MATKVMDLEQYVLKGMAYEVYLSLISDLLSEGKTTGPNQDIDFVEYTKLNLQRMERLNKTIAIGEELQQCVKEIKAPQTWLCITEAWCGDAAQNLPLFVVLANLNPLIKVRFVLRDENTPLIDQYLTNGGRAIPIVIGIEAGKEKWKWGPRPSAAQEIVNEFKRHPNGTYEQMKTNLHAWYAKNKTHDQQKELLETIK